MLASNLFDRFAPRIEWRCSLQGVLKLYRQAGLERVEIRRYRGWVSRGFEPTVEQAVTAKGAGLTLYVGQSSADRI